MSDRDPRTRTFIAPTRVLWTSERGVNGPERLLEPGGQSVVHHPTPCSLTWEGGPSSILLDFGRELHGGVEIITSAFGPKQTVRARLRFGESASEAMGETDQDHAVHDAEIAIPWCGAVEHGCTGFRFVRIDLIHPGARLDLVGVRAVALEREPTRAGSFRCSDERVNAVWETSVRTVELCMQNLLWDGIKRDRLCWMGDLHPEAMVIAAVHGDQQVVRDTLDFLRDTTPLPGWMNGLGSYSLWWIICHRDWWRRMGNRPYLEQQRAYLVDLLRHVVALVKDDGRVDMPSFLVDWGAARDGATTDVGRQCLGRIALEAGAELCRVLGDEATAKLVDAAVARIAKHALPAAGTLQATALGVLSGMRDAAEAERTVFAARPYAGLSTFYGYYVLEARTRAGAIGGCLDLLRNYWGPMLDLGATSFWEHFDVDWLPAGRIDELPKPGERDVHRDCGDHCYVGLRHSLCHGWAGGPGAWAIDHVLGIHPVEPGYATLRVEPELGDLAWAEGAVATPYGAVHVRHERRADNTVASQVLLPPKVKRI